MFNHIETVSKKVKLFNTILYCIYIHVWDTFVCKREQFVNLNIHIEEYILP